MKITKKYFEFSCGRKEWAVTGEFGSLSFWFTPYPENYEYSFLGKGYGGVEAHYNEKSKPDYFKDEPCRENCEFNGGKCWHDGTSLWASEYWIPYIMPRGTDAIWKELEYEYIKRNSEEEET